MLEFTVFSAALLSTALGVGFFKRLSISEKLRDIPNERSSHVTPKPRGGGIVIVAVCLGLYLAASFATGNSIKWSYLAAASAIAAVSWVDDLISLPAWVRLCVHAGAAVFLVAGCGWVNEISVPYFGLIHLGFPVGAILTVIWLVWMTNAYNFMDGIDGLAGTQAVVAGVGWVFLGLLRADNIEYLYGGIIAFAALGFLIHNWQPATVFMGDVGSAFLGFTLAAMPLLGSESGSGRTASIFSAAVLLLWLFLFDTVYTFLKRLFRGDRFWEAHREHLYQRLVLTGHTHSNASLIYGTLGAATAAAAIAVSVYGHWFEPLIPLTTTAAAAIVLLLARIKKI